MSTGGVPPIPPAATLAPVAASAPPAATATTTTSLTGVDKQTALAFEQMLVQQLSQELATTAQSDPSDPSSSNGLMGSDPASSMYSSLIPTALTQSIMGGGGLGIANELTGQQVIA
jgi:hypothetical protein